MLIHNNDDVRLPTASTGITGKLNSPTSGSMNNAGFGPSKNNQNQDFKKFLQQQIKDAKAQTPESLFMKQKEQIFQANQLPKEINWPKTSNGKQYLSFPNLNLKNQPLIAQTNQEILKTLERNSRIVSSFKISHSGDQKKLSTEPNNPFDMLWNSNYLTKYNINDFIEQNKALKAKVWNYEKENRKMLKQLDQWGLADQINNEGKPFVDSSTLQKVFKDNLYLTVTKKQQMINLQETLLEKDKELQSIQEQIDKYKLDGGVMEDFEKDSTKEFYVVLNKAQNNLNLNKQQLEEEENQRFLDLEANKSEFKLKIVELADINNVYQFEVEVQQSMCSKVNNNYIFKLVKESSRMEKRFKTLDDYVDKLEDHVKEKQPQIQQISKLRQKNKVQGIGKIEKTSDEILRDKISLIEEQKNKIDQLNFQIQEMTRTCILEKQDLLKDIKDTKENLMGFTDKILQLRLNIHKFDKFELTVTSDKSNQKGDSIITQTQSQ